MSFPIPTPTDGLIQVAQGWISTHCPQLPVNQPLLLQTDQPQIRGENLFRACKTLSPDWIFLLYNFPLCFVEGLFFFSMCLLHRFGFLFSSSPINSFLHRQFCLLQSVVYEVSLRLPLDLLILLAF